jgi:hypothetical protein
MVLLEATRAPLGLGVDETTAVIATQSATGWQFEALGAGTAQLFERSGPRRFRLVRMASGGSATWPWSDMPDTCVVSSPLVTVDPDRADFDRAIGVLARNARGGGVRLGAGNLVAHVCADTRIDAHDRVRRYVVRLQD